MVPILLGYYSPQGAVIMSPLFFGIAHFHHMIERIRRGQDFQTAFFISSFQFAYTTVFGMYSAFLFVRTGHLASCVIGKSQIAQKSLEWYLISSIVPNDIVFLFFSSWFL